MVVYCQQIWREKNSVRPKECQKRAKMMDQNSVKILKIQHFLLVKKTIAQDLFAMITNHRKITKLQTDV